MTLPYQPSSATSQAAAASMEEYAPTQKQQVLDFIIKRGINGATREEIADSLPMQLQTVCSAVNDLVSHKNVVKSSVTPTRPTRSGRQAEVVIGRAFSVPMQSSMFGHPVAPRINQYS